VTHTGDEHAVDAAELNQAFGNPLKLEAPLKRGVRVIAAHCASEGYSRDFRDFSRKENFRLFLDMMDQKEYEGLLYADVSAMLARLRAGYLTSILERDDLHNRLIYGSDYPVPAINIVVSSDLLVSYGLITREQKNLLDKVRSYNPVLFSILAMRMLKHPTKGTKFPSSMFYMNALD